MSIIREVLARITGSIILLLCAILILIAPDTVGRIIARADDSLK